MEEVVEIKGGKRLPKKDTLTQIPNEHPYIRVRDIQQNHIDSEGLEYVPIGTFPLIKNYIVSENDIIISIVGSIGLIAKIPPNLDKASLTENCVKLTRYDLTKIDPEYLFYFLTSSIGQHEINSRIVGSTQPKLPIYNIRKIQLSLPPLSEQKRISSILSSFDNKIEQLKKENNILEDIAQSIFKEWFVKYNFPNKDGKPYKDNNGKMIDSELGLIPEGWRVTTLRELVDTVNGYSYKGSELRKSDSALVTLKNFNRHGGFKEDGLKEFIGNPSTEQEVQQGDLVVAHTDLTQDGEVLGNPILIPATKYTKLYITMDCVKVIPKKDFISKEFLYYLMLRPEFKGHCLGYANGTTVLHLSKKAIPEYKISIPQDNYYVFNLFNKLAKHQQQDISKNIQMINSLTLLKINILNKLIQ